MRISGFLLVVAGAAGLVAACSPSIDPVDPPARTGFSESQVVHGARLAAMGNCITCHTAEDGKPFAGGRALTTQYGTFYGTNITPDPDTGIGRWSLAAFQRSLRRGVDREGRHLYPAFPYDHYTKLTDADIGAIYAYLMTREPVRAEERPHDVKFPFNMRPLLAGWKLLFLDEGAFEPTATQNSEWNRGAYLVEGIGHCGACHTPRNWAGAVKTKESLAGGEAQGWHAPPLTAASPAPVPWTKDSVFTYLRTGWDADHGVAAGPMKPVVDNLAPVPDEDLLAMATYLQAVAGEPTAERLRQGQDFAARSPGVDPAAARTADPADPDGRAIYAAACANCHEGPREFRLGLSTSLHLEEPGNLIHYVLDGIAPADGQSGPTMPGFASVLTDTQVAAVANFLRQEIAGKERWAKLEETVQKMRKGSDKR
jgi:mono/diheme cytochrome c family protein